MTRIWTSAIAACMLVGSARAVRSQTSNPDSIRSTQSGVFTAEQADLGRDVYLGTCRSCHTSPAHTPAFKPSWTGRPLFELFAYISENMPKSSPASLSPEEYAQVLAYTLQALGMPAGNEALPSDSVALAKIRFDTVSTKSDSKEKKP